MKATSVTDVYGNAVKWSLKLDLNAQSKAANKKKNIQIPIYLHSEVSIIYWC